MERNRISRPRGLGGQRIKGSRVRGLRVRVKVMRSGEGSS